MLGERPLADCNSLVRFGKRRDAWSCKGEPAPILALDKPPRPAVVGLLPVKGDFEGGIDEGSVTGAIEDKFR